MIPLVAGNGLSAAAREEVALELGSLMGAGERWNASWRWDHAHPRTSVELAVPFRLGLAGVVTVSGAWERFRYGIDSTTVAETRRTGGLGFGAWVIPAFRPALGLRYDRWSHDRRYIVLSQGNAVRLANDRLTLRTTVETGIAGQAASSYLAGSIRARWASSSLLQRTAWSIRYGWDLVDSHTPAGLWPFASGDVPWAIPLRAHPFTLRDLLPAATIARTIMHGGVAVDQPVYQSPLITLALGGFVDWALLRNRLDRRPARTLVDGGGGLRIGFAGGALGIIRIDVATGLNDDHSAVTVGLHREWPL
jgi:hypothetical protein